MSSFDVFYLAPLQGFTDFVFRRCYHEIFGDIETYYIPYISLGKVNKIRNSQLKDILPQNNENIPVVPQILCSNVEETKRLVDEIKRYDYSKLNLNLGCPFPMATNRGRGTGLLENRDQLKAVLDLLFSQSQLRVSVKFRAGLTDDQTIFKQLGLLRQYPFEKWIFHPRTARQLYKGAADRKLFSDLSRQVDVPLVYNGDIYSSADLKEIKQMVPDQKEWMIGRGVLNDPLLISTLKGKHLASEEAWKLKRMFHDTLFETYQQVLLDEGHVLIKMKQFWSYFSNSFSKPEKTFKPIKKASKISRFREIYPSLFPK